jgi:hypothetical protein
VTYQLIRVQRNWPRKDYTFSEIAQKARRLGLTVRNGYGRSRIRQARKLILSNGVQFRAVDEEQPSRPFGPRTAPDPADKLP